MTVGTLWTENNGVEIVAILWTRGLKVVFADSYNNRYKMSQKRFRKMFSEISIKK